MSQDNTWRERFREKFVVQWADVDEENYYRFNVDEFKRDTDPFEVEAFIEDERRRVREEVMRRMEIEIQQFSDPEARKTMRILKRILAKHFNIKLPW